VRAVRTPLSSLWVLAASLAICQAATAFSGGLDRTLDDEFRRADLPPAARDEALDRAAQALADDDGEADPRRLVREAGVYDGLVLPAVVVAPEAPEVAASWARYVTEQVVPAGVSHYGMARAGERLAFVFVKRRFVVEAPLEATGRPRTMKLVGRLATGFAGAKAVMSLPDERVVLLPTGHFGSQMTVEVPLTAGDGGYTVEIVASGEAGTEVIALWELQAGGAMPALARVRPAGHAAEASEHGEPAERVLAMINRERRRLGLRALTVEAALVKTAQSHAGAMALAGQAAHRLPGGRGPDQRLARAGIRTLRFYENVAMARTLEQAHAELWASPSHRLAMLDPEVNRVGVGVATRSDPDGELYFVAQQFAER
jgi:uncharacterized protein YkwD